MLNAETFREAMQRMAAPVTAITTIEDDMPAGLMATAVCSLSAEPASLVVCINRTATAHDAILRTGVMGVSLLPDHALDYAGHFARTKGIERFSNGNWIRRATGAPIFAEAPVAFDCRVARTLDGYSHSIVVADILDIHFAEGSDPYCLLWHQKDFVKIHQPQ